VDRRCIEIWQNSGFDMRLITPAFVNNQAKAPRLPPIRGKTLDFLNHNARPSVVGRRT